VLGRDRPPSHHDHPGRAGPHREVRLSRWRLGLLAGASLLAPAVQVVQLARREQTEDLVTAVASMVLFGLVLARLQGLAGEVAALATGRKRLLDRTVQAREEERIRLAAELHDGPIQRLTGVAYTADLSRRRLARADLDGGRELLGTLEDDIRGEVSALRRVMVELRPRPWTNGGWRRPSATTPRPSSSRRGSLAVSRPACPSGWPEHRRRCCTGSPQEALTNVAKHARAKHARVALHLRHGQVTLQVDDDGTGFATTHPADPIGDHLGLNHFGLASMRQQLEMAGGSLQVRSRPGQGTTISATLPVTPEPAPASTR